MRVNDNRCGEVKICNMPFGALFECDSGYFMRMQTTSDVLIKTTDDTANDDLDDGLPVIDVKDGMLVWIHRGAWVTPLDASIEIE